MNVLAAIERAARRHADALALRCAGTERTYAELLDEADRFAGHLHREGLRPGDRVGLYLHNEPEYLPALLGIWQAGGIAVPYNYLFTPEPLRHAVADSGARWLLAMGTDVERLTETLAGLEVADRIVALGEPVAGALTTFAQACAGVGLGHTVARRDDDDAVLMYTSGSTGTPKGVRQTHRNTTAVCEATIDACGIDADDHALVCTPLFHVGGLQLVSLPLLLAGGTVTLRRWRVVEYLDDVLGLHPTVLALVPAMMIDIVALLGEGTRELDSVRICMIGGSAMPAARLEQFRARTGVVPVNIYGQTEQSGLSIMERVDEPRREGSLGRPLDAIVEWQVVPVGGDEPLPAGADEPGELWVRGDAVTPGYWQLPEVNETKFRDGWFRTTDLVREAPDGFLYYVERADDMIISGGENIYPQVVEGQLLHCPLVAEVAVIGTAHERLVEQVTAIVVPTGPDVSAADVHAYCETRPDLRGLNRPRRIEIVDEIPRTATNKIDKPTLKKWFADAGEHCRGQ